VLTIFGVARKSPTECNFLTVAVKQNLKGMRSIDTSHSLSIRCSPRNPIGYLLTSYSLPLAVHYRSVEGKRKTVMGAIS